MTVRTVTTRLVAEVNSYVAGMARASAATEGFAASSTATTAAASRRVTSTLAGTATSAGTAGRQTASRFTGAIESGVSGSAMSGVERNVGASLGRTATAATAAGTQAGAGFVRGTDSRLRDARGRFTTSATTALGGASRGATTAGAQTGTAFSTALTRRVRTGTASLGGIIAKSMKTAGLGAAVGIAAIFAATIGAGFKRLSAIDQAKAKLEGLGHSASEVKTIMDNALASVKGTAFGLDEAATTAASVVAAGIKPGKDLTTVLKTVADTATIAGTSMADMGAIFGSVAARGKLQGDDLLQLQSKGVPVLAMLAKHYGITAQAASQMVTKGEVDFRNFAAAMKENLGGAALKSGDTFIGAFKNFKAALGRIGADLLSGIFPKLQGGFVNMTNAADGLEDSATQLGKVLGTTLGTAATVAGVAFHGLAAVVVPLASAFQSLPGPVQSFAKALIAVGIANRLFGNQLASVRTRTAAFVSNLRATATATGAVVRTTDGMAVSMGRFGSAIAGVGTHVPVIARMQGAFVNASSAAARFPRAAGLAAGAMTGMRSAASGLVGALGGPWGIAIAAAGVGLMLLMKHQQDAAAAAAAHKQEIQSLTQALEEDNGVIGENVRQQAVKALQDKGALQDARDLGLSLKTVTDAALGNKDAINKVNDATGPWLTLNGKTKDAAENIRSAVEGESGALKESRTAYQNTSAAMGKHNKAAKTVNKETHELQAAFGELGPSASAYSKALDSAAGAEKKAKAAGEAMKKALDSVNNTFLELRGGERGYEAALDDATAALKKNGKTLDINTSKGRANSEALDNVASSAQTMLKDLADNNASASKITGTYNRQHAALVKTAEGFGMSAAAAKRYADQALKLPKEVKTKVEADVTEAKANLNAAQKAVQQYGVDFDSLPKKVQTKLIQSGGKDVVAALQAIGINVLKLPKKADVKAGAPGAIAAKNQLKDLNVAAVTANGKIVMIPASSPKAAATTRLILGIKGAQVATNGKRVDIPTSSLTAKQTTALINGIHGAQKAADGKHVHIPTAALNTAATIAAINRVLNAARNKTVTITTREVHILENRTTGPRLTHAQATGGPAGLPGYAMGGVDMRRGGSVHGPGSSTSDSILARLSVGNVALSDREHVFTAAEVRKAGGQGAMYSLRAAIRAGAFRVPGYAGGGTPGLTPGMTVAARGTGSPTIIVQAATAEKGRIRPTDLSEHSIRRLADEIAKRPTVLDGQKITDNVSGRLMQGYGASAVAGVHA